MDQAHEFTTSPGAALSQASLERVNQQRYEQNVLPTNSNVAIIRESSVHEKVAKFDSLASQGKMLERKTADAALKRAMLGREQAEDEMRRYREDVRVLRKQIEEGKDRERKVGERLESVMESYGRAKETHAHTQALWEKEIRRARKEAFKSQSAVVKLQEELKATRIALRAAQSQVDEEKESSSQKEREAFTAINQLVGTQEELAITVERVKRLEQERDAFKTIAKNEEIARIAAEGQIPLPPSGNDDEFSSPKKTKKPLPPVAMPSSAGREEELVQLRTELEWERHRADKAYEIMEYMQIECQFRSCSCRAAEINTPKPAHGTTHEISKPSNEISIVSYPTEEVGANTLFHSCQSPDLRKDFNLDLGQNIFGPVGVSRSDDAGPEESSWMSPTKTSWPLVQATEQLPVVYSDVTFHPSGHARTPSCEPPSTALTPAANTSLLSLLDNCQEASEPEETNVTPRDESSEHDREGCQRDSLSNGPSDHSAASEHVEENPETAPTSVFRTISTTTKIPLSNPPDLTPPSAVSEPSANPLSPTMSREEALAQIRERRGRARSFAQGTLTPRKQIVGGAERRDCSAPALRSASGGLKVKNSAAR